MGPLGSSYQLLSSRSVIAFRAVLVIVMTRSDLRYKERVEGLIRKESVLEVCDYSNISRENPE